MSRELLEPVLPFQCAQRYLRWILSEIAVACRVVFEPSVVAVRVRTPTRVISCRSSLKILPENRSKHRSTEEKGPDMAFPFFRGLRRWHFGDLINVQFSMLNSHPKGKRHLPLPLG